MRRDVLEWREVEDERETEGLNMRVGDCGEGTLSPPCVGVCFGRAGATNRVSSNGLLENGLTLVPFSFVGEILPTASACCFLRMGSENLSKGLPFPLSFPLVTIVAVRDSSSSLDSGKCRRLRPFIAALGSVTSLSASSRFRFLPVSLPCRRAVSRANEGVVPFVTFSRGVAPTPNLQRVSRPFPWNGKNGYLGGRGLYVSTVS